MFSGALAFVVWSNAITKGIKDLNQIDVLLLALTSVGLAFFGRIFIRE